MINFLDTSAVLRKGALKEYTNIYVSPITLSELENIKTSSNKSEELKYLARNAVRDIIYSSNIGTTEYISQHKVDKTLKKYKFLLIVIKKIANMIKYFLIATKAIYIFWGFLS